MKPKVSLSSRAWLQIISRTIFIKIYLLFLSLKARNPLFLAKWIARKTIPRANIPGTTLAATVAPVPVTRNISKKNQLCVDCRGEFKLKDKFLA